MVFLIDLPRSDKDAQITRDNMTFFGKELVHFLEAMGLQQEIIDSVYKFDFSKTKGLAFVHSMFVLPFPVPSSEHLRNQTIDTETAAALMLTRNGNEQAIVVLGTRSECSACSMMAL